MAKKRETSPTRHLNPISVIEKNELRQLIKDAISQNVGDEFFENYNHGVNVNCILRIEDFDNCEDAKELSSCIAKYIQNCDGYVYK